MVKFPFWGILDYADSLSKKISPIFYTANANPNPAGPSMPQYGNYPEIIYVLVHTYLCMQFRIEVRVWVRVAHMIKQKYAPIREFYHKKSYSFSQDVQKVTQVEVMLFRPLLLIFIRLCKPYQCKQGYTMLLRKKALSVLLCM